MRNFWDNSKKETLNLLKFKQEKHLIELLNGSASEELQNLKITGNAFKVDIIRKTLKMPF